MRSITPGKDRLYLTNITRNRVEVFNLADSSFKAAVIVGSRPWGITAWPRDRAGTKGDTLLVANSGGTQISYVDLNAGLSGSGAEVFRYVLPNIIVLHDHNDDVCDERSADTGAHDVRLQRSSAVHRCDVSRGGLESARMSF